MIKEQTSDSSPISMGDLDWLPGKWIMTKGDRTYTEHWKMESENKYKAHNYLSGKSGIVFEEFVDMVLEGNNIIYRVKVPGQNDGKAIDFKLTSTDPHVLVFENPHHDFPNRMRYAYNDGTLHIIATGNEAGKDRKLEYLLSKSNE